MLKRFLHNNFGIILINLILLLVFILDYGRFGDVIVDSFREAYIPERILDGKLLYRDIFTIYAPFSYLFNALLFKIFGIKLSVLYCAGVITASGILTVLYKISNKFLPKLYGFGICLLTISTAVISANVFNMVFPYSYGIMYGLLFALLSIYFALKKIIFYHICYIL